MKVCEGTITSSPAPTPAARNARMIAFVPSAKPKACLMLRCLARLCSNSRRSCWRMKDLRSEEHTSELQSQSNLVCRLLLEKKKKKAEKETSEKMIYCNTTREI